jgi:uncharacterized membrane protein (DUF373 family)
MDDENKTLIQLLKKFERVIILIITCAMALVLVLVTLDLIWLIGKDIRDSGLLLQIDQLLDIFGLFMLVLIGVELFESVFKSYLQREHTLRVELVIAVATSLQSAERSSSSTGRSTTAAPCLPPPH